MDSCFALPGARQHCVAKICNASQQLANAHKLQNDPCTISSSVLWTHLRAETRVATSHVSGRKEAKCQDWCLEKQKNKCGRTRRAKQLSTVAILIYHAGVSKRFSRSISLAVYCLSSNIFFFWLIRSLVDPTLAAFIVCDPLQFMVSQVYSSLRSRFFLSWPLIKC